MVAPVVVTAGVVFTVVITPVVDGSPVVFSEWDVVFCAVVVFSVEIVMA